MFRKIQMAVGAAALMGAAATSGQAWAAAESASMQAEIDALRAQVNELRQEQRDEWLNERRAEEVKALVREVLSDASTRATLLEDGVLAGWDSHPFIQSADGNYKLEFTGQFQFRYIVNVQGNQPRSGASQGESQSTDRGFQLRRLKLGFQGHAITPKFYFKFVLVLDRGDGNANWQDDVYVGYKFAKGWRVQLGNQKVPFLREELLSSSRQLAIDRSNVTEFFTQNRALGVQVRYDADLFRVAAMVYGGSNTGIIDFNNTALSEVALAARVDIKVFGEWSSERDFNAWDGQDPSLFVGGAVVWQTGGVTPTASTTGTEYLGWTLDGLFKTGPFSVNAAYMGGYLADAADRVAHGVLVQGGWMVIPDTLQPYARYQGLDTGVSGEDFINIVSVGANYFFKKHNLKITGEVAWVVTGNTLTGIRPFGASATSTGIGFNGFTGENQLVFQAQLQFLY